MITLSFDAKICPTPDPDGAVPRRTGPVHQLRQRCTPFALAAAGDAGLPDHLPLGRGLARPRLRPGDGAGAHPGQRYLRLRTQSELEEADGRHPAHADRLFQRLRHLDPAPGGTAHRPLRLRADAHAFDRASGPPRIAPHRPDAICQPPLDEALLLAQRRTFRRCRGSPLLRTRVLRRRCGGGGNGPVQQRPRPDRRFSTQRISPSITTSASAASSSLSSTSKKR